MIPGLAVCAAGLVLAALLGRRPRLRAAALALALGGFFAAFAAGLPRPWGRVSTSQGLLLLFSAIALFRVMAGFEKGR